VSFKVLDHEYGFKNGEISGQELNSENKIIHGDNLEALKSLLPEYEGKIKCIYIDPPYNTGNESWVYNDNVNDPKIRKWLGQVVGKEAEDLTRHDKWLCMMYPRLKLLHKLLAEDGAIFISIDDNEQANLKLICDEIFGGGNFISTVAVINNFKGRSDDKYIATAHESLLIYQKGKFISKGIPIPNEYLDDYKEVDQNGKYRLLGLRKRGSNAREIDRPNLFYPIYFNLDNGSLSLEKQKGWIEILPKLSTGENGTWRWGRETFVNKINEIEVRLVKGRNEFDLFQKDYLIKDGINKRIKPKSFWIGSEFSSESGTLQLKTFFDQKLFQTPKSVNLIEYCLFQISDPNSIILDSFAGSGTTAQAVLNLNKQDGGNRKFILIEMEDYAESITAERVRRVIKGYGNIEGTGGSFNFYKLGKSIFHEDGNLNEDIGVQKIREYIWYTETKRYLKKELTETVLESGYDVLTEEDHEETLLGLQNNTAYYLHYNSMSATTLNYAFLSNIKTKAELYIIYADNCLLSEDFMAEHHIIFKKIPRDISRF